MVEGGKRGVSTGRAGRVMLLLRLCAPLVQLRDGVSQFLQLRRGGSLLCVELLLYAGIDLVLFFAGR